MADDADSVHIDTLNAVTISPCTDCPGADTLTVDSSNQATWAAARLQMRQQQLADSLARMRPLSITDSLHHYFLSERLNQRSWLDMAWFSDAGDYFRSDPSFFVADYQATPMRKTVQPFGLAGDRMNVLAGSQSIRPFDHPLEPDGLFDFNDFPTALDNAVYLLPGPAGMLLGGERGVASLVALPLQAAGPSPEIKFLVDKGYYAHSYARAGYKKSHSSGRQIDFSIGYRKAGGPVYPRSDDAYHYYGDVVVPLKGLYVLKATGRLYDRESPLVVNPDVGGRWATRVRIDRGLNLTLARSNNARDRVTSITWKHIRQASRWYGSYRGNFNYTSHGVELTDQRQAGGLLWEAKAGGDYLTYAFGDRRQYRTSGYGSLKAVRLQNDLKLAVKAGVEAVEDFKLLPSAAFLAVRETERTLLMASIGYTERAPSTHELYHIGDTSALYSQALDYTDRGNPGLKSEKQLTGNLTFEYGTIKDAIRFSLTGGRITDGINWRMSSSATGLTEFAPVNSDVDFATVAVNSRLGLWKIFSLLGGGAYHYQDHSDLDSIPYAPEYQAFGGAEMHVYWPQRLLHLYAYGEVVYVGPYEGYSDFYLGETAIVNVKLSFGMRSFRFHWVFKNALAGFESPRDFHQGQGQFVYYGFTWDFLD